MTPDVNVLMAPSRSDHPHHKTAYAWLAAAVIQPSEHLVTFDADFKKLLRRAQVTVLLPTAR